VNAEPLTLYDRIMLRRQGVVIELCNREAVPLALLARRAYATGKLPSKKLSQAQSAGAKNP